MYVCMYVLSCLSECMHIHLHGRNQRMPVCDSFHTAKAVAGSVKAAKNATKSRFVNSLYCCGIAPKLE